MLARNLLFTFSIAVALAGCSGSSDPADSGQPDAGEVDDMGVVADAGRTDTGPVADTGPADTGPTDIGPADTGSVDSGPVDTGPVDLGPTDTGVADMGVVPFEITSTAFNEGDTIPLRNECGPPIVRAGPGENISPDLAWTAGPAGTMSYAIVMDDIDSGVIHWVIYDIDPNTFSLAEDFPAGYSPAVPAGSHQAEIQGSGYFGYFGPCSPNSVNTYRWTIYAVPTAAVVGAMQSTTERQMVTLLRDQGIATAVLTGES